ncbi:glucosaminidase domain-containing protein [Thalassotalea mangrovi]|uniref:Glucosaminidase n=1 Tax=Thalassotalea mangrovi TaxID=2572245 RepID=A0A4U1B7B7_9GAMM|nr:glucosaminidase domain-containing protein [Thalassotalea mangrovi]TKB45840.1 glucosaminidase [Thalassotalea mangrovi]
MMKKFLFAIVTLACAYILLQPICYWQQQPEQVAEEVIEAPEKTKPVKNKVVRYHDVDIPDFASITDVSTRKKQFFNFLRPEIVAENKRLLALRKRVLTAQQAYLQAGKLNLPEKEFIAELVDVYDLEPSNDMNLLFRELLLRVDQIPMELVMVQAANESAWGSSRFAQQGLNFFGLWCFKRNCGMVPKGRDTGARHEVATFDSVQQMLRFYFHNLNSHYAYDMFRSIRGQLREHDLPLEADVLATGLLPYSQRGIDYIVELHTMLRQNQRYFKTS